MGTLLIILLLPMQPFTVPAPSHYLNGGQELNLGVNGRIYLGTDAYIEMQDLLDLLAHDGTVDYADAHHIHSATAISGFGATNTVQITDDRWGGWWYPGEAEKQVNLVYSTRQLLTINERPGPAWAPINLGEGLITLTPDPTDGQKIIGYTLHRGQQIADACNYRHAIWHGYFSEDYDPSLAHVGGMLKQAGEPRGRMKSLRR